MFASVALFHRSISFLARCWGLSKLMSVMFVPKRLGSRFRPSILPVVSSIVLSGLPPFQHWHCHVVPFAYGMLLAELGLIKLFDFEGVTPQQCVFIFAHRHLIFSTCSLMIVAFECCFYSCRVLNQHVQSSFLRFLCAILILEPFSESRGLSSSNSGT